MGQGTDGSETFFLISLGFLLCENYCFIKICKTVQVIETFWVEQLIQNPLGVTRLHTQVV